MFDRFATEFMPQVASSSALAQQLPTLALTPAGSVELKTAFSEALASGGQLGSAGDQATLSALSTYIDNADGGGWVFTSATPSDNSVAIGFTRTVNDPDVGLDIRDPAGTLSLSTGTGTGTGINVTGTLTGSFTLAYDAATSQASLSKPALSIATTADLPAGKELDAGLGILGVRVTGVAGPSDYNLSSNVTTTWSNPDNDAAGSLSFDNAATPAPGDGELAADGAGTGLVTAVRTGTVAGLLEAKPRPSALVSGLPSVGATVTLASASPATFEAPAVTAVVPQEAQPFLTLTPRDLASGLSQAASAIIGMQDAKDGNLPLMRGSIGNAVDAVGGIKQFLADQVPDADPADSTPGQPKFASLQDMLAALDSAAYASSGWSIEVLEGADAAKFDPVNKVVNFTIRATRAGVSGVELNILGAATTGKGTYTADGLQATGVDFDGPQGTSASELIGRKVTAGASYGTIATISSATSLTLTADGWSAGVPTDNTSFSVEAADPKTGAPEFANTLQGLTGIGAANADLSTATMTPKVDVTLPMALDLSAPLTYVKDGVFIGDCDPSAATAPCPFQQVDASGLGRVINSLPLPSDRILLRQSARDVVVADVDITSPVQLTTSSGFLGLSLSGDLKVSVPAGQHLQTLALTSTGDIPIPAFVEKVRQQAVRTASSTDDVFSQTLGGSMSATIDVRVDDAPDAFAPGVNSTSLTVTSTVAKLADGIGAGDVTVVAANADRAALLAALNFEPDNPTSLFGGVQAALQGAGSDLTTMTGGGLDAPIPFVGSSVGQLIGAGASGGAGVTYSQVAGSPAVPATTLDPAVPATPATTLLTHTGAAFGPAFIGRQIVVGSTVATIVDQTVDTLTLSPQFNSVPAADSPYIVENELLGAVHVLQAMTPATMQETVAMAEASLGNNSTIDFGLVKATTGPQLRLDVAWQRAYDVSRPVALELGAQQELVAADAGGQLSLEASGTVNLRLFIPLSSAAMLDPLDNTLVDEDFSSIDFGVKVAADDIHMGANIGPISVELGKLAGYNAGAPDLGSFNAGFGVEATSAGSAPGVTSSISDFFADGFDVAVTNGDADCDAGVILCADLPVYVNGTKPSPLTENLTVTSTLGTGDDLADVFTGTSTDVALPTGLQKVLDGTPFKFDSLADGLQQYLFYSETALRTAANDGEMPVIGKDLQAGADFMGDTRVKLDTLLTEFGDISTVGPARTLLVAKLHEVLDIPASTAVLVDFTCNRTLDPPPAPTGTPTGAVAADTTAYLYKVVTTYKTTTPVAEFDSIPSDPSAVVTNASSLSATKFNTVTWTAVDTASSYKILRATQTGGVTSAYTLVGSVTKPTVTFKDIGASSTAYTAQTKAKLLPGTPCADTTSLTQIEGVTVALKMGQGNISVAKDGCKDTGGPSPCLGAKLPVDLGLPGLSLKTGNGGSVSGKVGWALDLKLGLSRTRGFYIDTSNVDEFEVGASLALDDVPGTDLSAQLSIINVDVQKRSATPEFVGHFGIDIKDSSDAGTDLTLAEMSRLKVADSIVVSVNATVNIDWHLEAAADAALPGVSTDFLLTWKWGAASGPSAPTSPKSPANLVIKFNKVTLDAGDFFGEALKPYLQQIENATKPLQPIIDTIFTPMPVISDLSKAAGGQAVTIASLAETFNTLPQGAKIKPFLDAIKLIKRLQAVSCSAGCKVLIGSFDLSATRVVTTNATAGNAKTLITNPAPVAGASNAIAAKDTSNNLASPTGASRLAAMKSVISIPVIEDPTILFGLISGGDIPLVEFDSGPLSLGFQFQKSFGPIYAPPPVMMVIGGGASVTLRVAAGFDTYGIRRAIETGEAAEVLDSLYFKTVDNNGVPLPVVSFTGYLEAGASISLGILEVGVVGGIKLTVGFYWNDPNNDGKFRLFEFSKAVANNPICLFNVGGELSLYIKVFVVIGVSPFSVDFDFTLVNIKLLDFNLKPNCTPPPPRLGGTSGGVLYVFAGTFGGGGPRGDAAWDAGGKDETWVVRQVPPYTDEDGDHAGAVEVRGLGLVESFPDTAADPISTVLVDGRGYGGALTITFTGGSSPVVKTDPAAATEVPVAFTKTAVVLTGVGKDVIRTGEGNSWVDSGGGDDVVTTLDRTDLAKPAASASAHVAGGAGSDVITVGNGNDTVSGDGSLDVKNLASQTVNLAPAKPGTTTLLLPADVAKLTAPTAAQLHTSPATGSGADQIAAGLGQVVLSGNDGNDTIGTANDSTLADSAAIKGTPQEALYRALPSVLVGGGGSDVMKSGSANDELYTGSYEQIGESGTGAGDLSTDTNTVDSGVGSDTVYGSNARDFVATHSTPAQTATVFGGGSSDVLTGGLGTDKIYGGPDDDYLVAAPATVGEPGSATDVLGSARDVGVLPGAGISQKLLVGGTGTDRIFGSDGPSRIFGDTTADACEAQSGPVSKQPGETTNALDADDLIFGGTGVDIVNAGGGHDWVYASGAADRLCGNAGDDHVYGGDADDLTYAGSGADQAYGEAGADQVYGNDGSDALYGAAGADRLQGNNGADWVDGGTESDVLLGGTSQSGTADGADVLLGAGDPDLLVGDNADSDVLANAPYPTDLGSSDGSLGGSDYLGGGDGDDVTYGGLGDDRTYGGLGDDYAEGNPGTDRVWGEAGDDDIAGGSSQLKDGLFTGSEDGRPDSGDFLYGGTGQDVVAGDNARVTRTGTAHPITAGRGLLTPRAIDLADESAGSPAGVAGGDYIESGDGTDLVFAQRGNDQVSLGEAADYGEGGPGVDDVHGDAGNDDIVGGSFTPVIDAQPNSTGQPDGGDTLAGDAGEDVVLGDNGSLTRPVSMGLVPAPLTSPGASSLTNGRVEFRSITPYDLGESPVADASGADVILGGTENDVLLAQGSNDSVDGGSQADYAEGGQGSDLVLGGSEDDDVVGGSSATTASNSQGGIGQPDGSDNVYGGPGSDLAIGDNGLLTRPTSGADWRTVRADATQSSQVPGRNITLFDLNGVAPAAATPGHSAPDSLSGQSGVDVLLGQDGNDSISGGDDDDYAEGQGGADTIHGDVALSVAEIVAAETGAWTTPAEDITSITPGQDDLAGGSSRQGHRDGNDFIHGDADDDFVVGDNGSIARVLEGTTERVYTQRYGTLRTGHAKVRVAGGGAASTRFCSSPAAPSVTSTCEVADAFGADVVYGDSGQDTLYGQDGADMLWGGTDDDDIYGELGADVLHGQDGEDAIMGDRGGFQTRYETGSRSVSTSITSPPAVTYVSRQAGSVSREADLLHDVNGTDLAAVSASSMPLDGISFGGVDRIRGGDGHDSIHAGAGDDLVNGDSGGDSVFGGRGKDALWGGLGQVCAATDTACLINPGANGEFVDHLAGGKDGDVIDWRPRGVYGSGLTFVGRTCHTGPAPTTTQKDGTTDPCTWFEMTDRADDVTATPSSFDNNQHHQGVDWVYGGWDRDVMQGDLSENGPHPGDRLIDWRGVYNLYSHCNAAYGGFTDVRTPSPGMEKFLREWATGNGAGRPASGSTPADVAKPGTSAYDELALVTTSDGKDHGTGSPYPSSPGHFDDSGACGVF